MRVSNYCTVCGSNNQASVVSCGTCSQKMGQATRRNPINSASFRSPTLVVFDIDDTILDVSQRYKDAKRARIIDKEGYPVRKKTLETPGKARKRANQFLFSPENLRKDRLIPGALGLVEDLAAQGHTIAYVTARHSNFREVTRNQLEDKGFPLFQDETGSELLFLKAKQSEDSSTYKRGVFDKLNSTYDIRMVFDDKAENLQAAVAVGITGVYPSIQDYTKYQVKSNPGHLVDYHKGQQYVTGTDSGEYAYQQRIDEDDPDGKTVAETSYTPEDEQQQPTLSDYTNPPIKTDILPIMSGEPTTQHKKLGAVFAEVQVGRNIFVDVGEGIQDIYRGLIGGRQSMSEKRMAMAIATMEQELSDRAKKLGGNAIANLKLDFELPSQQGKVLNLIATADAIKMRSPPKAVRNNPANPSKVEKGKKLYKHMNGKLPEKIEKKTVDMGDVWYQVGEGGCWSIGYMSGKETGKAEQKYNHTFNEETKDGNFPKLYATMPENGKPMLIIQGGTWKIRTDDKGVAWIYD
jgi:uncharacterized protein YbjQ (UPF0145 family)/FMN phosphatase YigB (HAD superfamily)